MKKITFSILAIFVPLMLLGAGCATVYQLNPSDQGNNSRLEQNSNAPAVDADGGVESAASAQQEKAEAMVKTGKGAGKVPPAPAATSGRYEPYAPQKLARANSGKVVLFFRASWCPTCHGLDADIRAHLNDIPKNLTILDVDYDNAEQLKKQYGVTYQHTFVQVDAAGQLIKKWSGSPTLAVLVSEVE